MTNPVPHVPISWGEMLDKITILQIKTERLPTEPARDNAAKELGLLQAIAAPARAGGTVEALTARLKAVNEALWEIEDRIREHEHRGHFDAEFIELARSVYKRNDERGRIKQAINLALGSELAEEKSYKPY
jgi:hypothetical protein